MRISIGKILILFLVLLFLFGDFVMLRQVLKTYILKMFKSINKTIIDFSNRKKGN